MGDQLKVSDQLDVRDQDQLEVRDQDQLGVRDQDQLWVRDRLGVRDQRGTMLVFERRAASVVRLQPKAVAPRGAGCTTWRRTSRSDASAALSQRADSQGSAKQRLPRLQRQSSAAPAPRRYPALVSQARAPTPWFRRLKWYLARFCTRNALRTLCASTTGPPRPPRGLPRSPAGMRMTPRAGGAKLPRGTGTEPFAAGSPKRARSGHRRGFQVGIKSCDPRRCASRTIRSSTTR